MPAAPLARRRIAQARLLLAPALIAAVLVAGWPLARTLGLAFTDASLGRLDAAHWIGFDNFTYVLGDPGWWRAVRNTLVFAVVSVALELGLGLAFALLLHARLRVRPLLAAVLLIPWAVPTIVSAQMWAWMFHDIYGVINDLALRAGLISAPRAWLADPVGAMAAVIVTDVWKTTPFTTVLMIAGLAQVPAHLHDAARLDGAGALRRFVSITLPLLGPAILVALIFRTLDALRVFDLIYVMTSNSRASASVSVYARQELVDFQDAGIGSAASVLIVVLVAAVSLSYVAALGRRGGIT